MEKTPEEAMDLILEVTYQDYYGEDFSRDIVVKGKGTLELDSINMLSAQLGALTKALGKANVEGVNQMVQAPPSCSMCGGPHEYVECSLSFNEDVNYIQG